jgi:hypothetical protein
MAAAVQPFATSPLPSCMAACESQTAGGGGGVATPSTSSVVGTKPQQGLGTVVSLATGMVLTTDTRLHDLPPAFGFNALVRLNGGLVPHTASAGWRLQA